MLEALQACELVVLAVEMQQKLAAGQAANAAEQVVIDVQDLRASSGHAEQDSQGHTVRNCLLTTPAQLHGTYDEVWLLLYLLAGRGLVTVSNMSLLSWSGSAALFTNTAPQR